jgi:hypothetical protein
MQFVEGCTLQQKLDRAGPLPVREILRVGIGIADGLAAAHRHGLVHRDVKPANVLLENGVERVKLTDFGLARAADDASLTRSGVVAGTPAYMSPEQAGGGKVDPRSDLFSLGSVLYALCTGRPPFRADTAMAVLRRVCDDTPRPIRETNPEIPEWLAAVVARLQAKDPGQRFATAAEVANLLSRHLVRLQTGGAIADAVGPAATPSDRQARRAPGLRRAGVLLGAGAVVAGLIAGGWLLRSAWLGRETADRQTTGPPEATGPPEPRPGQPAPPPAEEPAGRPDTLDEWRRAGVPPALRPPLVANGTEAPPELVAVVGSGPFQLPARALTHWPVLTADGRLLALPWGNTVVFYDAHTGAVVRVLTGHVDRAFRGDFSADGKRFACGSPAGEIRVWDVATGKVEVAIEDVGEHVWTTLFAPGGEQLVTSGTSGTVRVWDAATGRAVRTLGKHEGGATHLAFSPDGARLASAGVDEVVKVWDWKGGELLKTLKGHREKVERVAYSPDGTWLATGSPSRVLVWDAAALELRQPLEMPGSGVLAFTPDGQTLVTAAHELREGTRRSFARWDVKTWTRPEPINLPGSGGIVVGALSPDGRTLYAMSCQPPDPRLGVFDAGTGEERFAPQGHTGRVWGVAVSPDGRWLASGGEDGRTYLWDLSRPPSGAFVPPAQQLPQHADHAAGMVVEPLDRSGHVFAAWEGGEVVGTLRSNFLRESDIGYYFDEYRIGDLPASLLHATSITTRLAVHPRHRKSLLATRIACETYRFGLANGIETDVIDCRKHLVRYFTGLGYLVHRGDMVHPEYSPVTVMRLNATDSEHLEQIRSPFRRILHAWDGSRRPSVGPRAAVAPPGRDAAPVGGWGIGLVMQAAFP